MSEVEEQAPVFIDRRDRRQAAFQNELVCADLLYSALMAPPGFTDRTNTGRLMIFRLRFSPLFSCCLSMMLKI